MNIRYLLITIFLSLIVFGQEGNVSFRIYDEFSQQPVATTVKVIGTELIVEGKGTVYINHLHAKEYSFEILADGYQPKYINDISIVPNQTISFSFGLEKLIQSKTIEGVVLKKKYKTSSESPVSFRNVTSTEIQKNAGSNRDVSKAMLSFPGVGSAANFRNDLFIRGGNSSENKFFVDGIEVPIINHFQTQGASGGPRGILTVDFLNDVDFYSGAFPAKRNGMLSSLFEFHLKEARKDKIGYKAVIGLDDMQIMADGPLNTDGSVTGLFSVRKSNLQLLFKAIGLPFLPSYYDATFKVSKKLKNGNELYLLGIGAIDQFEFNTNAKDTPSNLSIIERLPKSPQWSYTVGAGYQHLVENGNWLFTLSRSELDNKATKYFKNIESKENLLYNYHSKEKETRLRIDRRLKLAGYKLEMGMNVGLSNYENESINKSVNYKEFNFDQFSSTISFIQYGFYLSAQRNFFDNQLSSTLGLRIDATDYSTLTRNPLDQFSPRLSVRYRLSKRWAISANIGSYYQLPPYTSLGFKKENELINKRTIRYIQNNHIVSGIAYNGKNDVRITLEGYYKFYRNYPYSLRNEVSLANLGGGFGVLGNEPIDTRGKGKTYGLELLAQKRTSNNYYGILAYTFGYSKFTNEEESYQPSSWDSRHLLSFTFGKNLRKNWNLGARLRLQSGLPETPYDIERSALVQVWDINNGPVSDYKLLNSKRGNLTHQLDFRIEKKWIFKKWQFSTYIDIVNVYGSKSPSDLPVITLERTDQGNGVITNPNAPFSQQTYLLNSGANDRVTPLPYFGFIFEF